MNCYYNERKAAFKKYTLFLPDCVCVYIYLYKSNVELFIVRVMLHLFVVLDCEKMKRPSRLK